ncbi:ubiquinol oxidase subunit II [Francisellaceae bacterium]|nr:ubiquinol oxidase subunit II [Francisellaceae bacterium]
MKKIVNLIHHLKKMVSARHIFKIGVLLVATLFISGCAMSFMSPKGMVAADQKTLLIVSVLLMLIVVLPVIFLIFYISWRYRASNKKATYSPNWSHNTTLEIIWWTIPCIIIVILAIITWISTHRLDPYKPLDIESDKKPIVIEAIALDWKWLFIYPEQNIATINYIQFPVDVPITFKITSDAPMNAFIIPSLAGQIYAMEGMQTQMHLIADEKGSYTGRSSNFSGEGFSGMIFTAKASAEAEYENWVSEVKQTNHTLDMTEYNKIIKPSENNKVEYFSPVQDKLFQAVINKFMTPDMHHIDHNMHQEVKL